MNPVDFMILATYFSILFFLGFFLRKRSAKSLNAYFLGGRKVGWLWLAMSGSVSNFDITGTMFICSLLFSLGMKSMWVHMMWGIFMGAFFMSYTGRWVRSSGVLTAAQWMVTRFGDGAGGRVARLMYAVMAIVTLAASVGYAFQGVGKFASIYLPLTAHQSATVIIGFTTIYAMLGGLRGVVVSDVIQTVVLSISAVVISWIAWSSTSPESIARILPSDNWSSLIPEWKTDVPGYEMFGLMVIVWSLKGFLLNMGGPGQMYDFQRFLAARSPADAAKTGAAWSLFLIVRWPMCAGIAILALNGLGEGVSDPEQVMPLVFRDYLPSGLRGFVLTGFIAAFMSTFSSVINSGASFMVRDIWQEYFAKDATERQLIGASYSATVLLVLAGIGCGFYAKSIAQIWNWIMMALGSGVIIPNVMRWHWWRMNGWGYAAGIVMGMTASLITLFLPETPVWISFPLITGLSSVASVIVSLVTPEVPSETLIRFYRTVRPFGLWAPVQNASGNTPQDKKYEPFSLTVVNVTSGIIAVSGFYLGPMYFIGHWYLHAVTLLGLAAAACIVLYFTWYKSIIVKLEDTYGETEPEPEGTTEFQRVSDSA